MYNRAMIYNTAMIGLFFLSLPLAAQSLTLSCPPPAKFNQPAVCAINFTGTAVALQWKLTTSPAVSLAVTSAIAGKSLSVSNGTYLLAGMNQTALTGKVATVTVPARGGTVTLTLSGALGSTATGHAIAVSPGVTVSLQ